MKNGKITIKNIADEVGVSTSLVSFVMNGKGKKYRVSDEMTQKILEAAKRLDYRPNNAARSLRSGKTHTIGVILSDISNKFFADIARCIEDRAYEYGYTVVFGSSDENNEKLGRLMSVLISKGVDGLIIVPCAGSEEAIRDVDKSGVPVVLLDRYIEHADISCVVLNNRKAMSMAVDKLISEGSERIDMISYDMALTNVREREDGYLKTMRDSGLEKYSKIHKVGFKSIRQDTDAAIRSIHAGRRKVDAIVFATNSLTIAALKSLEKYGMNVPQDIAVVGFDGSEAFELYYTSLTYIKQPIEQFGLEALELVVSKIENGSGGKVAAVTLNPEIVEGMSSAGSREALAKSEA